MEIITHRIENGLVFLLNQNTFTASVTFSPNVKGEVIVPNYVIYQSNKFIITLIESFAFHRNLNIESLKFAPNSSIHQICEKAFIDCSIISLSIPESLVELDTQWCLGANRLSKIEVDPQNKCFAYIDDTFLIKIDQNRDFNELIFTRRDIKEAIVIPSDIKRFSESSFFNCSKLESISSFSENSKLEEIGNLAFNGCKNLEKIAPIPSSVRKVGNESFEGLQKLESIEFLSEEINFGVLCFWECSSLACISFPYAKKVKISKNSLNGVSKNFILFFNSGAIIMN